MIPKNVLEQVPNPYITQDQLFYEETQYKQRESSEDLLESIKSKIAEQNDL